MAVGKILFNQLVKKLEKMVYGQFDIHLPDGKHYQFVGKQEGAHAVVYVKNWHALTILVMKGSVGAAEGYREELWDTDNLPDFLLWALENEACLQTYYSGSKIFADIARLLYLQKLNTIRGSQKNIHAHYDLGNDFYRLFLDNSMSYSSAIYHGDNETLEQAQNNKYDRILEKLGAKSGTMLEIGCGWGGMLERAMHQGDFDAKGITISEQQYAYATQRMQDKGIADKAKIVFEDYRLQQGVYDYIVSIEMFEAVGEKFWGTYFDKIKSSLHHKGKAILQTIVIDNQHFETYRKSGDVIRSYIFPGGLLPSVERFQQAVEKADLRVVDNYFFRGSYVRTLEQWSDAFQKNLPAVQAQGFDTKFIKIWQFYLATCIAGFKHGRIDVMQSEIIHAK